MRRKDMRPGQVFGLFDPNGRWLAVERDALIVLDATTEMSFWTGVKYRWGEVAPSMRFEVLS